MHKTATISEIGWYLYNNAPDVKFCPNDNGNISISFFINFHEKGVGGSDIDYINIKAPTGKSWHFHSQEVLQYFTNSKDYDLAIEYIHLEDTPNLLPLGEYFFEIVLLNGKRDTEKLNVPAPGSRDTDGNIRVYTEEYKLASNPPDQFISMPKRAIINDSSIKGDKSQITIKFSADDSRIYNGWIYLYDSEMQYIGSTNYFRNFNTGELINILNNGADFYTDGRDNQVILTAEDVNFHKNGYSFKDISNIRIAL